MRTLLVIVLLALAIIQTISGGPVLIDSNIEPKQDPNYRLTEDIKPLDYDLTLTPYMVAEGEKPEWTFDGFVKIRMRAFTLNLRTITLHANALQIHNTKIYTSQNANVDLFSSSAYENGTHKLVLTTSSVIATDRDYFVEINYSGLMSDEMRGFYRSTYVENGVEKRMGTTQFQPTYARQAFPCFDEPKFKSNFNIKIRRLQNYHSLSNTKKISEGVAVPGTNRFEDTFEMTPYMSTYLIAFIVSEYTDRSNVDKTFGVWARPDMQPQTNYSYIVGLDLLKYLDEYTQFPYSTMMSKMDMAAIPDFSAGAMENWGLLTYRETNLVNDDQLTTPMAKQRIAAVITHEQAHMWFGDLVTCDWWGYTWLNEGFARYHQYFSTGKVETKWDLDLQFVVEQLQGVFQLDSTNSTHPMNHVVNSPAEVSNMFDNISYNKGASVIRMIEHLMGADKFLAGIRQYLKDNEYGTTTPDKLYAALQVQAGSLNIAQVMGSWANQEGYPVLQVDINSERTLATLSQKRFLLQNSAHTDNKVYQIPLTFANKNQRFFNETTHQMILNTNTGTLVINSETWTIFNVQQVGFYRVNYDSVTWGHIRDALLKSDFDGIHVLNRAQIVDDVLNLARGGLLDYEFAFDVLDYLDNEKNYIPWLSAFSGFSHLSRRLANSESGNFQKYILKKLTNIYSTLGFNPKTTDTQTDLYNRVNVLQWACKYGHEECIENARSEFEKAKSDVTYLVPVAIRQVVYCTGVMYGSAVEWDWLWERYTKEKIATEQVLIMNALGCTNDESSLKKYLDQIFTNGFRKQDQSAAFTSTYSGHDGNVERVWNYLTDNRDKVITSVGASGLASYMSGLSSRFTSRSQVDTLEQFMQTHSTLLGSSASTLTTAVNSINYELHWTSQYLATLEDILYEKAGGGAATQIYSTLLIAAASALHFYL